MDGSEISDWYQRDKGFLIEEVTHWCPIYNTHSVKKNIEQLTTKQLFEIANISTGGYFSSQLSSNQKENETGGYGKRRQVQWTSEEEEHFFEISAESKKEGWNWYSWTIDKNGNKHIINCLNMPAVTDYCDEHKIAIRNV